MRRQRQHSSGWLVVGVLWWGLSASTAWGYFFDDRREMSLSGFFYSRQVIATSQDNIGTFTGFYQAGNLVSSRNFLTLEWRHNINRLMRSAPTLGPAFEFLNFDALDYYLNLRETYEGTWDYGITKQRRQLQGGGGTSFWDKYYNVQKPAYNGEFSRFRNFEYITSINYMEKKINQVSLFEWYFNITKGPLFIRIGRQNLSWGETDAFRLLDQINPLDNLFGGSLVPLDERRVPLNMLRAQWSFGTVGPVSDLTLEGFISPDRRTAAAYALNQGIFWNTPTNPSPVEVYHMPCGGPVFGAKNTQPHLRTDLDKEDGPPCSVRAPGPRNNLSSSRGGGRILGTIHDFTFSIAHYYTWQDNAASQAGILSPSPAHLAWDLSPSLFTALTGKAAVPANNPWGTLDPTVNGAGLVGGPGAGAGVASVVERNLWVPIREKRIQITGASLSFPVNALTGMFVGSDNPLYYLYTTFRSEVAYFRNVMLRSEFHDAAAGTAFQRFLTVPIYNAGVQNRFAAFYNPEFLPKSVNPNAHFSSEGTCRQEGGGVRGCRLPRPRNSDAWAFNIGLDHNQWITWLNPSASFAFTGQFFLFRFLNGRNTFKADQPANILNDARHVGVRPRSAAPTREPSLQNRPGGPGNRTQSCITAPGTTFPCIYTGQLRQPYDSEITTFGVSTTYMGGNLRPALGFQYDWAGSWLLQPSVTWVFWDPFRVNMTYNWIEGNWGGLGTLKFKDNIWFELQYLLY